VQDLQPWPHCYIGRSSSEHVHSLLNVARTRPASQPARDRRWGQLPSCPHHRSAAVESQTMSYGTRPNGLRVSQRQAHGNGATVQFTEFVIHLNDLSLNWVVKQPRNQRIILQNIVVVETLWYNPEGRGLGTQWSILYQSTSSFQRH
jgi:hypothetical protein